jgi:hypothetical protein
MSHEAAPQRAGVVLLAWLLLTAVFVSVALPRAGSPGLYYDEAFFAQQAKDFFEPERGIHHPASTRELFVFGRPFPLRNALYLGSLKSQLVIPSFALFGTGVEVLRLSTAATSLFALLLLMLWANRVLGWRAACLGGVLALADPSYWFFSLYEWGPFTTLLLCRAAGLYFVTTGWMGRSRWRVGVGGLALGLGVFARADFAVVVVSTGAALLAVRPAILCEAWRSHRGLLSTLGISALLGAAPMLLSVGDLVQLMGSPVLAGRGDLSEKLQVLYSLAEGSRFYRIMETGGLFERMGQVEAPQTLFVYVAIGACAATIVRGARRLRSGELLGVPEFLLVAGVLVTAATVMLPGAVRAHHLLNAFPFFHLLVGATAARVLYPPIAGLAGRGGRAAILLAVICVVVSDARVIAATYELIERTGGRGRWSQAMAEPARWLESDPQRRGISLDWGFHEPLLFLTRRARLVEPIWDIRSIAAASGRWRFSGGSGDLYLLHDREYDHFGFGPPLLVAARQLAETTPDAISIRSYTDRDGQVAFWSVQVDRRHSLVFQRGQFRFELSASALPGAASDGSRESGATARGPASESANARAKIRFPSGLKWGSRAQ